MVALALAVFLPLQEGDSRRYDVPLDALYDNAYRAALVLDWQVDTTTKTNQEGTYRGRGPDGQEFAVRLLRTGEATTRADVAVTGDPAVAARFHAVLRGLTAD